MKKVGLAVCYDTKNFGSQLQVLATIKKVEELGFETEIIRYKKKMSPTLVMQSIPRLFNPYFIKGKINKRKKEDQLSQNRRVKKLVKIRNKRFEKFQKKYLGNVSPIYDGWKELKESNFNYDYFLCGSDQLWLPNNLGSHFYTLEFVEKDKRKIAYATSFGVKQIPWYQKRSTKKYLKRFQYLSSRELSGVEIINDLTGRDAKVVCDPTLLLKKEEWEALLPKKKPEKEKYIFCYFLGNNIEHRRLARRLQEKTKLKIVTIPFLDNYVEVDENFGDTKLYDIDAFDFINYIKNAEYVFTDSFHGTIFSILFHKKFLTLKRFSDESKQSRNTRIDSLFEVLEIKERRYNGNVNAILKELDTEKIDKNLNKLRKESLDYLKDALK